jgi:hypothetical protein
VPIIKSTTEKYYAAPPYVYRYEGHEEAIRRLGVMMACGVERDRSLPLKDAKHEL